MRDVTDLYEEFGDQRLPPGQREEEGFPTLSMSGVPHIDMDEWEFTVSGAVETGLAFDWDEFRDLPSETQRQDFHCVTGWSRLGVEFTGVPFREIAERAGVDDDVVHVMFGALDDYTTDLPYADVDRPEVLFAYELDGDPLPEEHGGPLRVVTPHKYAYKGAKWVDSVTFLTEAERGYWEQRGYSDSANPWAEERYTEL